MTIMTHESKAFSGVWPDVPTPLKEDLSIDHARLYSHVRTLFVKGVHGVLLFGDMGEGSLFDVEEKLATLAVLIEQGVPADAIMLCATCPNMNDSVKLIRRALSLGLHGVTITPPSCEQSIHEQGVVDFFDLLIARVNHPAWRLYMALNAKKIAISNAAIEAVFDTPSDLQKFGYAPTSAVDAGRGMANADPIREHLGVSAHLAASLIGKAASAVYAKIKKGRGGMTTESTAGGMDELADLWKQILTAAHELLDLPPDTVPTDEQIRAGLEALRAKGAAPVTESVASADPLPPELLAALLLAHQEDNQDAVDQLLELANDPALLAAVMDGPPDDDAVSEAVDRSHLVFDKVKKRWVNPNKQPPVRKTPAGQLTPKEQLIARKQAAEPARQAARAAWAGAVADPSKVTADQLAGLADHLHALTRKRSLMLRCEVLPVAFIQI